jgi:ATP-dependent DNA helicase RecG
LCKDRFLSLRDMSELLNRQQKFLQDDYVRSMVREGLLELRFPQTPNHQDQAYRTRGGAPA